MGSFPNAYIINLEMICSSTRNRNVSLALKCMANEKFSALQPPDRYSDSRVEDISDF